MWKPPVNFITLHYAYIITMGLMGLIVLYPHGNLKAVDAYFFGASGSTESGLNTVDVKDLKLYQQLFIYVIPIITNLGFINPVVGFVRLHWFEKRLKAAGDKARTACLPRTGVSNARRSENDPENNPEWQVNSTPEKDTTGTVQNQSQDARGGAHRPSEVNGYNPKSDNPDVDESRSAPQHISFAPDVSGRQTGSTALYVPPPRERDNGQPITELDGESSDDEVEDAKATGVEIAGRAKRRRDRERPRMSSGAAALERVASTMFVLGSSHSQSREREREPQMQREVSLSRDLNLPSLSNQATLDRNSQFRGLTPADREELGGIEYRSLKLLLKIVIGYFFGIHLFGAICLAGWIRHANPKYRQYLQECGQDNIWWAFYSSQTMVDNLGFTLTPDSMISFQDAAFPMALMSFLAFAGNTFYPCMLRLLIWIMFKAVPKGSSLRDPLNYLLKYPRRCYTLLFPSQVTWTLFGILAAMNTVDMLLILVLDLKNPEVNHLPAGRRFLAALFQAASSRHTGTSSFNLANVNPAVQFSLLVMMYIAIFPIAISIRASNTYEESALGLYPHEEVLDEQRSGKSYVLSHIRNQLTFDLWYIFIGIFCICVAEADKIMDNSNPAFSVFAIFFEVTSAYGNVGLSLGHPDVLTSLSGKFTTFSKVVTCAMMVRGRHRGLPYQLDRSIMLPNERGLVDDGADDAATRTRVEHAVQMSKFKRHHTR